ncbi:hypothetical protein KFE25_010807 [Diacronema lutheri]|uniref:Uncharacterized protein n=1 Tax=Diacronema lutheri TaxID=2081491 RepID=A0A8J5XBZ1_DIALT|nr:hypothetical protein KFE25_010807 [Diacronema lutheri]
MQQQLDQDRINRNVNELSAKLLEGCKLLSESCPETNVPLVLTKDGRMFSVGNNAYYRRDGGKLVVDNEPPQQLQPHATYDSAYAPAGGTSVAARGVAPSTSALCGAPPAEQPAEASAANLSQRVAAKLLDGWQLLAESCPETNVPLVHSRDGQILSVGTGKYYARESTGALRELPRGQSFAGTQQQQQQQQQQQHAPHTAGGTAAPSSYASTASPYFAPRSAPLSFSPSSRFAAHGGSHGAPHDAASLSASRLPFAPAATYPPPRAATSCGAPSALAQTHGGGGAPPSARPPLPARYGQTLNATLAALYDKLDTLQAQLAHDADVGSSRQLVASIHEIAAAIGAVNLLS